MTGEGKSSLILTLKNINENHFRSPKAFAYRRKTYPPRACHLAVTARPSQREGGFICSQSPTKFREGPPLGGSGAARGGLLKKTCCSPRATLPEPSARPSQREGNFLLVQLQNLRVGLPNSMKFPMTNRATIHTFQKAIKEDPFGEIQTRLGKTLGLSRQAGANALAQHAIYQTKRRVQLGAKMPSDLKAPRILGFSEPNAHFGASL